MNQKLLVPEYFSEFQCIGDKCEDTCCQGWFISVDKPTYKKYRKIKDEKWRKHLIANVKRNKKGKDDASYAYLTLNEKRQCSFLSTEGLCGIHKELGSSFLCETCKTYPRLRNNINGNWEQSLSTSCPEAARIVLLERDGLTFTYSNEGLSPYANKEIYLSENTPKYLEDYWEIRSFIIEILQYRNENLEDRLKIIGYFIDSINIQIKVTDIKKHIDSFRILISSGKIHQYFINPFGDKEKLYHFLLIFKSRLHTPFLSNTFKNCVDETFLGLELINDNLSESNEAYKEGSTKYLSFLKENDYKLENYLVNTVFNSLMPSSENPLEDYAVLINYYFIIRTMVIGRLALNKEITDEYLVKLIYSFGRSIESFKNFPNKIIEISTKDNTLTLPNIVRLI